MNWDAIGAISELLGAAGVIATLVIPLPAGKETTVAVVNPRHEPRPAWLGMGGRHRPEWWPGMLRNRWPACAGIRRCSIERANQNTR
jgi:hypothetical protein